VKVPGWVRAVFICSGLFESFNGIVFLVIPGKIFQALNLALPADIELMQLVSLITLVFAVMYFNIARNPIANRNLIPYGILGNISFCLVVFGHRLTGEMPDAWVFTAFINIVFLTGFILSYKALKRIPSTI